MKKITSLWIMSFITCNLLSQEITLTFNPIDAMQVIDSIKSINMESGETSVVSGTNTISLSNISTGNNIIQENPDALSFYPNPFQGITTLQYNASEDENIIMLLTNSSGQLVSKMFQNIVSGTHRFDIYVKTEGIYILSVINKKGVHSQRLICFDAFESDFKIKYLGANSFENVKKSSSNQTGVLFHFFIYSGDNITKIVDTPTESKTYNVEFIACEDGDGRRYPVVKIGEQWWMAENLAYLPFVSPPSKESYSNPFYYVYEYDGTNVSDAKATDNYQTYGVLYNWAAALNSCPSNDGWHLPTDDEWEQLAQYVSDQKGPYIKTRNIWTDVGKHLKATGTIEDGDGLWHKDDAQFEGTDDFGFSGLPSGYRYINGAWEFLGIAVSLWSATENNSSTAWEGHLLYNFKSFSRHGSYKDYGFSIRCVRDVE